jgi:hypothetical protein
MKDGMQSGYRYVTIDGRCTCDDVGRQERGMWVLERPMGGAEARKDREIETGTSDDAIQTVSDASAYHLNKPPAIVRLSAVKAAPTGASRGSMVVCQPNTAPRAMPIAASDSEVRAALQRKLAQAPRPRLQDGAVVGMAQSRAHDGLVGGCRFWDLSDPDKISASTRIVDTPQTRAHCGFL